MSTGLVGFSPERTLRDFLTAPGQVAALSEPQRGGQWVKRSTAAFPIEHRTPGCAQLSPPVPSALL